MARIGDMNNRHERILNILANEAAASVTGLSDILGVSKETIRKDLQVLAEQGKVTRIHGGAALLDSSVNMPFSRDGKTSCRGMCLPAHPRERISYY